jgi:hypothetical protein
MLMVECPRPSCAIFGRTPASSSLSKHDRGTARAVHPRPARLAIFANSCVRLVGNIGVPFGASAVLRLPVAESVPRVYPDSHGPASADDYGRFDTSGLFPLPLVVKGCAVLVATKFRVGTPSSWSSFE